MDYSLSNLTVFYSYSYSDSYKNSHVVNLVRARSSTISTELVDADLEIVEERAPSEARACPSFAWRAGRARARAPLGVIPRSPLEATGTFPVEKND